MSGKWKGSLRVLELPRNWGALRRQVLARDKYLCQIRRAGCLNKATEVDHIQRGTNHELANLQAACTACHALKSAYEGVAEKARLRALKKRPREAHPGQRKAA